MLQALENFLLFIGQAAVIVIAILIVMAGLVAILNRGKIKEKTKINVRKLNKCYENMTDAINKAILSKTEYKGFLKAKKQAKKASKKETKAEATPSKKRAFILTFNGDIRASAVASLRKEVSAILMVAKPTDEVVLRLESPGGMVHGYGLAASQLQRIKDNGIPLTVSVDKVAASGGYMMACVADKILSAPFAIIGSIGVIAQLPNFNRLLKKHDVDFEQITAGQYKRTLTMFGENTTEGRKKLKEEIEDIHELFKTFVSDHRPQLDLKSVATGEHWFGKRAIDLKLVDELRTSDDYLLALSPNTDLYEVTYQKKKKLLERIISNLQMVIEKTFATFRQKQTEEELFW